MQRIFAAQKNRASWSVQRNSLATGSGSGGYAPMT